MVNKCPYCEGDLTAVCSVVVEYAILDDGHGGQDWSRHLDSDAVDDDSASVQYVECDSCGREWTKENAVMDREGYLVELKGDGGIAGVRISEEDEEDE